jgi:aminoacyl tRNA synthase complex-interacting multifunctional protein 1
LDIRVGRILSVEAHPDADTLYVEQIDVGEPEGPRTIVSGLRKYVSLEDLQGRSVVVLANLKPRNMRGVKSNGMLLCASNEEHTVVEPLSPPQGASVGERVFFGDDGADQPPAAAPNQLQKKKFWEACQPLLKTSGDKVAGFQGKTMMTSAGPVVAENLAEANIS